MKKLILLIFAFITINSFGQIPVDTESWNPGEDGEYKVAIVSTDKFISSIRIKSPMLFVQKTGDENIQIHLVYWPGIARCKTSQVNIIFDGVTINTTASYKSGTTNLPFDAARYIIDINSVNFMNKLISSKTLQIKLTNECGISVMADYTLEGVSEALEILN